MAMKDPGGPTSADIVIPQTMQAPNAQHTETGKIKSRSTLVRKEMHIPQTLHALDAVTPQTIVQRHTRLDETLWIQQATGDDDTVT